MLQRQVCQLETEKAELLQRRTVELEKQVEVEERERHNAEAALRQSEERLNGILGSLEDLVWSVAADTFDVLYLNLAAEKIYGRPISEFYDNSNLWLEVVHPEDRDRVRYFPQQILETGSEAREYRIVRPNGEIRWLYDRGRAIRDSDGRIIRLEGIATDITEKKQIETQFLRAQRLESLGTLASGIAHDLNNILTPILAVSQLLPRHLPDLDENLQQLLNISKSNAQRGANLVKQILTFTRGVEGDRGIVQVKHLIADIKQLAANTFPKTIEIQTSLPKNLWTVNGDATQLHQVLMNLAVNARDAMPNGGTLTISAENFVIDENYARMHLDAQEGSYILVTVSDTGTGIAAEIVDRIFEPFFTTKEIGRGTGLGLSTVIGIVKSHGGFVNVYTEAGQGTQFKVFLPATETAETASIETEEFPRGNGELILVVDDEANIREINRQLLQTYNYRVLTASDGIEAIALYAEHKHEIAIILMDMIMPTMDGATASRALQKINPQVKIIAVARTC